MRSRVFTSLLVSCLLVLGCSDDKKKIEEPDPDPYLKQTSIANCLFNLKLSYTQRNLETYKDLLDEDYTYVFAPSDAGSPTIPESWMKADEVVSASHLFNAQPNSAGFVCGSIGLDFTAGADVPSTIDPSWREVTLSQVQLFVDCRYQGDGDQLRYEVLGDQATLTFMQTAETDPSSGLKLWKIIFWFDEPGGHKSATESTTWGKIKASWR